MTLLAILHFQRYCHLIAVYVASALPTIKLIKYILLELC